jgi:hypothetical protein
MVRQSATWGERRRAMQVHGERQAGDAAADNGDIH